MLGYSLHLGDQAMHEWGWRIPFLIAGPIGLIGMYVRSKMEDTPIFREEMASAERRHPPGLDVLIRHSWRPLLVVGGLVDRSEARRVGKACVIRVGLGGGRILQKKKNQHQLNNHTTHQTHKS